MDYTIIGGAVNIASRLESNAFPGEILISYETFSHVKEQIECRECGEIEVKGIAYPVATYQVIDTRERDHNEQRRFHKTRPNVKLELDVESMSAADREQAINILREGLDYLANDKKTDS